MSNVIALPTRPVVEDAWSLHRAHCQRLAENPALAEDPDFMAELDRAESDLRDKFSKWARRA